MDRKRSQSLDTAWEAALRLLAMRDHGTEELRRKLIRKGFAAADVEKALVGLEERRLLDDHRYARKLAFSLAKENLFGPGRIRQKLFLKGIPPDLVQGVIEDTAREIPIRERLKASLGMKLKGRDLEKLPPKEKRQLVNYLRQRGFFWEDIAQVVQETGGFLEE